MHWSHRGWVYLLIMIYMTAGGKAYYLDLYLSDCCPQRCQALLVSLPPIHWECHLHTQEHTHKHEGCIPLHHLAHCKYFKWKAELFSFFLYNNKTTWHNLDTHTTTILFQWQRAKFCAAEFSPQGCVQQSEIESGVRRKERRGGRPIKEKQLDCYCAVSWCSSGDRLKC